MQDLRQTKNYAKYMRLIGWEVGKLNDIYYFSKKIPFIGRVVKIQRPKNFSVLMYRYINTKLKPFQIIFEPQRENHLTQLIKNGFKLRKSTFLPSKTIHIDLTKTRKFLLKGMHYKTRYNIKIAQRNKVVIKISKDIELFANFWQFCARKRGLFFSQKKEIVSIHKAFKNDSDVFWAFSKEGIILGGILMIYTKNIAYYMYAASTFEGKSLFAPTLLVWKAINKSKKRGCKIFDFEGIYDERFPLKSWLGFTRFKKSFGGKIIEYPGAFQKTIITNLFRWP